MFFTILTLCSSLACNQYYVDSANTMPECLDNLVTHSQSMGNAWADSLTSDKALQAMLDKYQIEEPVRMVASYDYHCEYVPDANIP